MNIELSFEAYPMRKRELVHIGSNQYRVIAVSGEIKQIEANTAYEAFKLSGLANAIKIERLVHVRPVIARQSDFVENKPVADNSDTLAEIMKAEADQFSQSKKLTKTVISADDLDKIMQGSKILPDEPVVTVVSQNASGTDLHGDGFDEIIPNTPPPVVAKAPAPPPKEAAARIEIPPASAEQLPPEKTLSPEEVEKLLSGSAPQ